MADTKPWYWEGDEGWDKSKREDAAARSGANSPLRFFQPKDNATRLVFLDTPGFFAYEHSFNINGNWHNYRPCAGNEDNCPACQAKIGRSFINVSTVIDTSEWEDKKGQKRKNVKKLFVAKGTAKERLFDQIQYQDKNLRGCVFEVKRGTGSKECATGEGFHFLGRLSEDKLKALVKGWTPEGVSIEDYLKPYDYKKLYKPNVSELRRLCGSPDPIGADDSSAGDGSESSGEDSPSDNGSEDTSDLDALLL